MLHFIVICAVHDKTQDTSTGSNIKNGIGDSDVNEHLMENMVQPNCDKDAVERDMDMDTGTPNQDGGDTITTTEAPSRPR